MHPLSQHSEQPVREMFKARRATHPTASVVKHRDAAAASSGAVVKHRAGRRHNRRARPRALFSKDDRRVEIPGAL